MQAVTLVICSFWLTLAVDWISFVAAQSMKEEQFFYSHFLITD
jgi:hypothetical protein